MTMLQVFCATTGKLQWANRVNKDKDGKTWRCCKCGKEHSSR